MDKTIKILNQTVIKNEVAKIGTIHIVPMHIAEMHVNAGNAEYVEDDPQNRSIGLSGSDSSAKRRKRKYCIQVWRK